MAAYAIAWLVGALAIGLAIGLLLEALEPYSVRWRDRTAFTWRKGLWTHKRWWKPVKLIGMDVWLIGPIAIERKRAGR